MRESQVRCSSGGAWSSLPLALAVGALSYHRSKIRHCSGLADCPICRGKSPTFWPIPDYHVWADEALCSRWRLIFTCPAILQSQCTRPILYSASWPWLVAMVGLMHNLVHMEPGVCGRNGVIRSDWVNETSARRHEPKYGFSSAGMSLYTGTEHLHWDRTNIRKCCRDQADRRKGRCRLLRCACVEKETRDDGNQGPEGQTGGRGQANPQRVLI